jgi:anaerobic magnesium-protoporphyrin IX monomethyl ester cyclase
MDVLLVDPPGPQKSGYNLGLAYLAGSLAPAGLSVGILDTNHCPDPEELCRDAVTTHRPRIVGVSIKSASQAVAARLAAAIRSVRREAVLVAGGPHVSLDPRDFIESTPEFDFAFAGECEEVFGRFVAAVLEEGPISPRLQGLQGLHRRGEEGAPSGEAAILQDLDGLAFPLLDAFLNLDVQKRPYQLLTSRGCPYPCSYCCVGEIYGRRWRARSPESVIAEIRHFISRYGNPTFEIDDDNFTLGLKRAKQLCRAMVEIPDLPGWCCPNGIRGDRMDPELAALMRQARCDTVAFGVESAVESVLRANQKRESLLAIRQAAATCRAYGIKTWGYFIIGLPGSTFAFDLESVRFAEDGPFDGRIYNLFIPYPGTSSWDWVQRNGRFLRDYRNTLHFGEQATPVFETADYPGTERALLHQLTETSLHRLPDCVIEALREPARRQTPAACVVGADTFLPDARRLLLGRIRAAEVRIADSDLGAEGEAFPEPEDAARLVIHPSSRAGKLGTAAQILSFLRRRRERVLFVLWVHVARGDSCRSAWSIAPTVWYASS